MKLTRESTIEEIVQQSAAAVRYLRDKGIKCIACGEPIWGTLEEAATEKGFDSAAIDRIVNEMNKAFFTEGDDEQG
jgi:methionine synthase II (cobalamin-independent)